MSTAQNGNAANIVFPSKVNIVSSTNANPSVVTTVTAHGLTSSDTVHIVGHSTNTSINGVWPATVLSANTFSVPVAGIAAGGATGAVQSLACGGTFPIPSDGDDDAAASVNVALDALADRTAALTVATGAYKLAALQPIRDASWEKDCGGTPSIWAASVVGTGGTWVASNNGTWQLPVGSADALCVGDVCDVEFTGTMAFVWGSGNPTIGAKLYANNVALGGSSSYFSMPGSAQFAIGGQATSGSLYVPVTLRGQIVLTFAGVLNVKLYGFSDTNTTTVNFIGDYQMTVKVLRPTLVPQ